MTIKFSFFLDIFSLILVKMLPFIVPQIQENEVK